MNYLPSKRFFLLTTSLTIGVLAILWASWGYPHSSKTASKNTPEDARVKQEQLTELNLDTDGDGLRNWEEALWKTDPKNADTDGDGTKDNDEILAKRDPRKPGPDDVLPSLETLTNEIGLVSTTTKDNITAKIAEEFANSYFQRKITSAALGNVPVGSEGFANEIFTDITRTISLQSTAELPPHFLAKDFTTTNSGDKEIETYINSLGTLFREAKFPEKTDIEIISSISNEQDLGNLRELTKFQEAYMALANNMKAVPVPQTLLENHVNMANNFWHLGIYVGDILQLEGDAINGVIAISGYAREGVESRTYLNIILNEIKNRHFTFIEGDGGYEFNKFLDNS